MICPRARIPTTQQLRAFESSWINACHENWGMVLMEAAGLNTAQFVRALLGEQQGEVVVVCGSGNNGGDGLVVARHLHTAGVAVRVFMMRSNRAAGARSESAINTTILQEAIGLPIHYFDDDTTGPLEEACSGAALIVDALLGTGLDREVSGAFADAIEIINGSGALVVAVDIPSGINSDTGQIMGIAIEADATATFGYLKAGLLHYPGAQHAGIISLIDIGLPDINNLPAALREKASMLESPKWWLCTHEHVRAWLPDRPAAGHKGTFGRVVAVAGSRGMAGSAMLATRATLRSGAGYCILATASSLIPYLPAEEIVYRPLDDTERGAIAGSAIKSIQGELQEADALLIGPGIGQSQDVIGLIKELAGQINVPCIIDADGLNAIAAAGSAVKFAAAEQAIMTPHPKELERLTGMPVKQIQSDRIAAAVEACRRFGCNIVLKGAHSVVATPNHGVYIVPTGNSGMATPGAGDVLSGVIAGLLGQGMPASYAAVAGTYIHGAAGDLAADRLGEDGMVAHDILDALPSVIAEIRDGEYAGRSIEAEVLQLS
jgi:NAD(P)H-hydrate epimerase